MGFRAQFLILSFDKLGRYRGQLRQLVIDTCLVKIYHLQNETVFFCRKILGCNPTWLFHFVCGMSFGKSSITLGTLLYKYSVNSTFIYLQKTTVF